MLCQEPAGLLDAAVEIDAHQFELAGVRVNHRLQLGEVADALVVPAGPVVDDHYLAALLVHVEGDVRIVHRRAGQLTAICLPDPSRRCEPSALRLRLVGEVSLSCLYQFLASTSLLRNSLTMPACKQRVGRVFALREGLHELGQAVQPCLLHLVEVRFLAVGRQLARVLGLHLAEGDIGRQRVPAGMARRAAVPG